MRTGLAGTLAALACVLWLTGAIAAVLPDADAILPALVRAANPDPTDEDTPSERSDCAVRDAVCHAGCAMRLSSATSLVCRRVSVLEKMTASLLRAVVSLIPIFSATPWRKSPKRWGSS